MYSLLFHKLDEWVKCASYIFALKIMRNFQEFVHWLLGIGVNKSHLIRKVVFKFVQVAFQLDHNQINAQNFLLIPVILLFPQPRQNLLSAANRVGEAQNALLRCMGSTGDMDPKFQVRNVNVSATFLVYAYCPPMATLSKSRWAEQFSKHCHANIPPPPPFSSHHRISFLDWQRLSPTLRPPLFWKLRMSPAPQKTRHCRIRSSARPRSAPSTRRSLWLAPR